MSSNWDYIQLILDLLKIYGYPYTFHDAIKFKIKEINKFTSEETELCDALLEAPVQLDNLIILYEIIKSKINNE